MSAGTSQTGTDFVGIVVGSFGCANAKVVRNQVSNRLVRLRPWAPPQRVRFDFSYFLALFVKLLRRFDTLCSHLVHRGGRKASEAANMLRRVLRAIMKCAIDLGLRKDDPTRDVKALPSKTDGFHTWTESEIERFEATHPHGSKARLAFALLVLTAAYPGDDAAKAAPVRRARIKRFMVQLR
jgi:hypothetical protein